jgi:hypothetical protein
MVLLPTVEHIMFIGSPRLASLDEMEERNMFLCDIPLYDVTREFVLLNQQRLAEVEVRSVVDVKLCSSVNFPERFTGKIAYFTLNITLCDGHDPVYRMIP